MTPDRFIDKWQGVELKERSASQSHFNDLCALLGLADPVTADRKGDWFTFEMGASKTTGGKGWADVWRKDCFAWEYKGRHADLDAAYAQVQRYSPALLNPPLLITSDMDRIVIRTSWTCLVVEKHEIALTDLRDAASRDLLLVCFEDPRRLRPRKTRADLTEEAAARFAALAQGLRERGFDAETVAHFVNRIVFCMFAAAPFHQIVTGAVSGNWWGGDLNDALVPRSTGRLGSPRGYYRLDFNGSSYVDTYQTFHQHPEAQMHMGFNTPRFRDWAGKLLAYADLYGAGDIMPPVTINDLGDMNMLTGADLEEGTWLAVNVWNGSRETTVSVSINGRSAIEAVRTQDGTGEGQLDGPEYADPTAMAMQSTIGRAAFESIANGEETNGYEQFRGDERQGMPGPWSSLATKSQHLWRADLPADLAPGQHILEVTVTDHHGRSSTRSLAFEVVEEIPEMGWNGWIEDE